MHIPHHLSSQQIRILRRGTMKMMTMQVVSSVNVEHNHYRPTLYKSLIYHLHHCCLYLYCPFNIFLRSSVWNPSVSPACRVPVRLGHDFLAKLWFLPALVNEKAPDDRLLNLLLADLFVLALTVAKERRNPMANDSIAGLGRG